MQTESYLVSFVFHRCSWTGFNVIFASKLSQPASFRFSSQNPSLLQRNCLTVLSPSLFPHFLRTPPSPSWAVSTPNHPSLATCEAYMDNRWTFQTVISSPSSYKPACRRVTACLPWGKWNRHFESQRALKGHLSLCPLPSAVCTAGNSPQKTAKSNQ